MKSGFINCVGFIWVFDCSGLQNMIGFFYIQQDWGFANFSWIF